MATSSTIDALVARADVQSTRPVAIDTGILADLYYYCLTLTCANDFTSTDEDLIIDWHRKLAEYCLLVREYHGDGRKHYHSLLAVKTPKSAGGLTRKVETLYKRVGLRWVKGVSAVVKKMTHMTGQFHYLLKDQNGDLPLLLVGWKYTWIKERCVDNVKEIPLKLLKGETYMVQKNTSVELVLKFAAASGHRIRCKASFIDLVIEMQAKGYQFDNVRKGSLYTNVMARVGCMQESRSVWESELYQFS